MILSAFQRFVEQATGELLPMYGMNFFMPSQGFAPIEDSPVPSDYLLSGKPNCLTGNCCL
ncbi:MAG: hypothetical protein EBX67_09815 [Betaproteobacteria bacterium]|nr:hypothetical protein [Betaproteobacteria bacterium]